jgi:hypothetical protein
MEAQNQLDQQIQDSLRMAPCKERRLKAGLPDIQLRELS